MTGHPPNGAPGPEKFRYQGRQIACGGGTVCKGKGGDSETVPPTLETLVSLCFALRHPDSAPRIVPRPALHQPWHRVAAPAMTTHLHFAPQPCCCIVAGVRSNHLTATKRILDS